MSQLLLLKFEDGEIKEGLLLSLEVDVLQRGAVFPLHATLHHLGNAQGKENSLYVERVVWCIVYISEFVKGTCR